MTNTDKIREWAKERNLDKADPIKQGLKLMEEVGELANALIENNDAEIIDAIGDCYVVLTILAMQNGYRIEDCIDCAYDQIKDRKGETKDGVFIKDSDS